MNRDLRHPGDSDTRCPSVAVVICTRDRPTALLATLRSLRTQTRHADELIIIDDGRLNSDAGESARQNSEGQGSAKFESCAALTRAMAEAATASRFIRAEGRGLTRARNQAARLATSDVLLYLDDDVTCEPNVIAEIARLMADPAVAGVTATVIEPTWQTRSGRLYQFCYRLAGWWSICPRGVPAGPAPAALNDLTVAIHARWLSGAAMALRRDVVLANPFDESLAEYALGEDREMGYRLSPTHWLLESRRARVVHRREASGRTDARRLGFMTTYNYIRILRRTCAPGPIEVARMAWGFAVLAAMHAAWAVVGDTRGHLGELAGMARGIWRGVGEWIGFLREKGASRTGGRRESVLAGQARRLNDETIDARHQSTAALNHTLGASHPKMRRVLFVTNRLEHGGAERMLLSLARRLPALGIEPVIACLKDAGPLAIECIEQGIVVHDHLLNHKTDAAVLLRLRQIIEAAGIDSVVVAHSGGDRMFWGTLAGRISGLPVVVWSHWFPRAGHRHVERANRALYRWIDAFVAIGVAHRDALAAHEGVPSDRIEVIRNGIELARYTGLARDDAARARLGLRPGEIGVGLIANLRAEKRHDVFLAAAARLSRSQRHLRFFIIGDGPLRERIETQVRDMGLNDTVTLLGARSDVPELLAGLDIACLCSEIECVPVVMLEAAAAGCAFIGPDVGGVGEFLVHRATGLTVNASDGGALADALSELSSDPALRRRLTETARARVSAEFDADTMSASFSALLHRLCDGRGTAKPTPVARPLQTVG